MDVRAYSMELKIAAAVGLTAAIGVGGYLLLSRGSDNEGVHEISPPLSTHHQMQVERKPDGHLVYHDKIKEEVDRINAELDRKSSQPTRRCGGAIFCGAPASGKGTQCERLVGELGYAHLSVGDMLRAAAKADTDLGKKASPYLNGGKLVPDEIVVGMLMEHLSDPDTLQRGWILDGFPRTVEQAQALKDASCQPDKVLLLDVPDDILLSRMTGRRHDPLTGKIYHLSTNPPPTPEVAARLEQRSDDMPEKLRVRLKVYHDHVDAVLAFYRGERGVKVVTIDGNRSPDEVYADVKREFLFE
jgi:adenylate kinase